MINVTKTFLPPVEEYNSILKRAWDTGWMTNRGVLVKELEQKLKDYLKVDTVITTTNGTLPLQVAIKALKLEGEIITTPFSYVATTSSIVWEGCTPVFVDIHPDYLTIDETKIEAAITEKTSAIMATHVYGNPCNIDAIDKIAKKHNLKVIYDAAHCFDVTYKGQSVFNYGDVSTCSFHATKLFHTGEGGAMFTKDQQLYEELFYGHNFGHKGKEDFQGLGINAKMSEPQAAMGLSVLNHIDTIISSRKNKVELYDAFFANYSLRKFKLREESTWNFSYYPLVFHSKEQMMRVKTALEENNVFPRRYFYPSLNLLPYVNYISCPISEEVVQSVLCLPLYVDLHDDEVEFISKIVIQNL